MSNLRALLINKLSEERKISQDEGCTFIKTCKLIINCQKPFAANNFWLSSPDHAVGRSCKLCLSLHQDIYQDDHIPICLQKYSQVSYHAVWTYSYWGGALPSKQSARCLQRNYKFTCLVPDTMLRLLRQICCEYTWWARRACSHRTRGLIRDVWNIVVEWESS